MHSLHTQMNQKKLKIFNEKKNWNPKMKTVNYQIKSTIKRKSVNNVQDRYFIRLFFNKWLISMLGNVCTVYHFAVITMTDSEVVWIFIKKL